MSGRQASPVISFGTMSEYEPQLPPERVEHLRRWHETTSAKLHALGAYDTQYLGLELHVPEHVFGPTPTSDLLGQLVIERTRPGNRALDMGCGAGANGVLAALAGATVLAVDVNPHSVAAAADNAARNDASANHHAAQSDLFDSVDGTFDLIVIDPPFRWFAPTDLLEMAITDENYQTLRRFFAEAPHRLRPGGEILLFFGASGDVDHLDSLIETAGFSSELVAERTIDVRGEPTTYFVRSLTH